MTHSSSNAPEGPLLDRLAANLVSDLGGRWYARRRQGLCLCPAHADRTPSLSVRVGSRSLLFHCFAGCTSLDVTRELRRIQPGALRRGMPGQGLVTAIDDDWIRLRARELWTAGSQPQGSPVETYLGHRSIGLLSEALRYHPSTPLGPKGIVRYRPAMLAAVHEGSDLVALQRTFLDADRGRRARDLVNPRRMLGRPGRGCVRLMPASEVLGLAEGLESALSAAILLDMPVWATLGSARFARVDIPPAVRTLVLLADNDRAGRLAVSTAKNTLAAPGRIIETRWPWHGMNDWNDVLRGCSLPMHLHRK